MYGSFENLDDLDNLAYVDESWFEFNENSICLIDDIY